MRTMTAQQEKILSQPGRFVWSKLEVRDTGGTWRDMTNLNGVCYLKSFEVGQTLEEPGQSATLDMHWRRYEDSMSFVITGQRYEGYIGLNQQVKIYVACMPDSLMMPQPSDYIELFHGVIDTIDIAGSGKIACRDYITATLQDRWVEADTYYGSSSGTDVEVLLGDILNDVLGLGAVTLYTPVSPGFAFIRQNVEPKPLFEALRHFYLTFGWDCRPKWRDLTSQFELTLYDPVRTKTTPDHTFGANQYRAFDAFGIDIARIRNVVELWYHDGSTVNGTDRQMKKYVAEDLASQAAYGRRWMQIVEDALKGIDTATEAQNMAEAILEDLKDPELSFGLQIPLFWPVELNDLYAFEPENQRFTTTQKLAVYAHRHVVDENGQANTYLTCSGRPKSGVAIWLQREARPGIAPTHDTSAPPKPTTSVVSTPLGAILSADYPKAGDWARVEFHESVTDGFTPSDATLIQAGKQMQMYRAYNDQTLRYYKMIVTDESGNQSEASTQLSGQALGVGRSMLAASLVDGVKAVPDADQTSSSSPHTVDLETRVWGKASMFDATTDTITPAHNGVHDIRAHVVPGPSQDLSDWSVQVLKNGNVLFDTGSLSPTETVSISILEELASSDDISLQVTFTGTTLSIDDAGTSLSVTAAMVAA